MSIRIILYVILFYTYYGLLSLLFLQICLTYSYIFPLHVYMQLFLSLSFSPSLPLFSLSFPFPPTPRIHTCKVIHAFFSLSLLPSHLTPQPSSHSLAHSFIRPLYSNIHTHTHTQTLAKNFKTNQLRAIIVIIYYMLRQHTSRAETIIYYTQSHLVLSTHKAQLCIYSLPPLISPIFLPPTLPCINTAATRAFIGSTI